MKNSAGYARTSITLPQELLEAADRMAASLSRSRSWLIAEAVRRLADSDGHLPGAPAMSEGSADSERSTGEGVRATETAVRPDPVLQRNGGEQLLAFGRYEDYLAWDRRSRSRP